MGGTWTTLRTETNFSNERYRNIVQIILMVVPAVQLDVMRGKSPTRPPGTDPTYSIGETIVGTALFVTVIATVLLAASYPAVAVGVAALALVARPLVRGLRDLRRVRRREGRARQVCVPWVGVCLEA
jgi:hypothetical protein